MSHTSISYFNTTSAQQPPQVKPAGYPPQQVTAAGMFDQGARFNPNKPVSVPVSPPNSKHD